MEIEDVTPASIAKAKEAQMRERIAAGVDQEGRVVKRKPVEHEEPKEKTC